MGVMPLAIIRRVANTRPCSPGATLASQIAWLEALAMGTAAKNTTFPIPMSSMLGRSPTSVIPNPPTARAPSTV